MRKIYKFFVFIFLLIIVLYLVLFQIIYKMDGPREGVYIEFSPNRVSVVQIYKRGVNSGEDILTPMEIECSNRYGTVVFQENIKNGHLIKLNKENQLDIDWNENENGGMINFENNLPIIFHCKSK